MEVISVIIGLIVAIAIISWTIDKVQKGQLYEHLKPRMDNLDKQEEDLRRKQEDWSKKVKKDKLAIETLAKEKSVGFPWLAQAYAEYFHLQDLETANYLEYKSHPARKSAEVIREVAQKRKNAETIWRVAKYQLEYYESLFPWLEEFKDEDLDNFIRQLEEPDNVIEAEDSEDSARQWLTQAEYNSLDSAEKYQLALDRYWRKKKNNWELGRDYERYIGYRYENKGWQVKYQGIIEGFDDLGRDLIATKDSSTQIVQCKHWSKYKTIHEKHIFQLYGSMIAYKADHPNKNVLGVFVTSTVLSERAKKFADILGITIKEQFPLLQYPSVKCNISRKDRAKIYHLPFDQQYDKTIVEEERNECYAETVAEAEALGFRRAFRWHGNQ